MNKKFILVGGAVGFVFGFILLPISQQDTGMMNFYSEMSLASNFCLIGLIVGYVISR
jgi:hypothetical protein